MEVFYIILSLDLLLKFILKWNSGLLFEIGEDYGVKSVFVKEGVVEFFYDIVMVYGVF